jgi:hypothetical protein
MMLLLLLLLLQLTLYIEEWAWVSRAIASVNLALSVVFF